MSEVCYNSQMREIPLSRGMVAIVDDDDYEALSKMKWHASRGRRDASWYAKHHGADGRKGMARYIVGAKPGDQVDHINGNTLDNRKSNLRLCSNAQNSMNSTAGRRHVSGFKGVVHSKGKRRPWHAKIVANGNRIPLGYYSTPEEAAHAYDAAALNLFGEFARTNFPAPGREDRMKTPEEYAVHIKAGDDPVVVVRVAMVAAADEALERAAQDFEEEAGRLERDARKLDADGQGAGAAAHFHCGRVAEENAKRIRALASPAAAPAAETVNHPCQEDHEAVYCSPSEPAAPEKKPFACGADMESDGHLYRCDRGAGHTGSHGERDYAEWTDAEHHDGEPVAPSLLPRVLAALEKGYGYDQLRALAAELRRYIAGVEAGHAEAPDAERDRNRHNAMLVEAWRGEFGTLCKVLFPGDDGPIGWKHVQAKVAALAKAKAPRK